MTENITGIIGGTGLGDALAEHINNVELENIDTPFGKTSQPIMLGSIGKNRIAFINRHGKGHSLSPSVIPYRANIFALKQLGVTSLIASGAVGSLRAQIEPGHLVLVDQFIDKTTKRENSFFDKLGAVHCEFARPCCGRLRGLILKSAEKLNVITHPAGTYVCMEGPNFSTRAESLMHRVWGGDLIGMTALPEAKLARQGQMCYALVAITSDYDCWKERDHSKGRHDLLKEIISNLQRATENAVELVKAVLKSDESLCDESCPCRKSLELAVWTKPDAINKEEKKKLTVLFE